MEFSGFYVAGSYNGDLNSLKNQATQNQQPFFAQDNMCVNSGDTSNIAQKLDNIASEVNKIILDFPLVKKYNEAIILNNDADFDIDNITKLENKLDDLSNDIKQLKYKLKNAEEKLVSFDAAVKDDASLFANIYQKKYGDVLKESASAYYNSWNATHSDENKTKDEAYSETKARMDYLGYNPDSVINSIYGNKNGGTYGIDYCALVNIE